MDMAKVSGLDVPTMVAIVCAALVVLMIVVSFVVPAPKGASKPDPSPPPPSPPSPSQATAARPTEANPPAGIGFALIDHVELGKRLAAAREIEKRLEVHHAGDYVDNLFSRLAVPASPTRDQTPTPPSPPKE